MKWRQARVLSADNVSGVLPDTPTTKEGLFSDIRVFWSDMYCPKQEYKIHYLPYSGISYLHDLGRTLHRIDERYRTPAGQVPVYLSRVYNQQ